MVSQMVKTSPSGKTFPIVIFPDEKNVYRWSTILDLIFLKLITVIQMRHFSCWKLRGKWLV